MSLTLGMRGSQRSVLGSHSLASISATLCAALVASLALWLAARVSDERILAGLERWRAAKSLEIHSTAAIMGILAALLVQFALIRWTRESTSEPGDDQGDYLRVARLIQSQGGWTGLAKGIADGEWREDNRHPLYVALLAIEPTADRGRELSRWFALSTTLLASMAAWRSAGPFAGMLAAFFLATNRAMIDAGSIVACETLYALLVVCCWWCVRSEGSIRPGLSGVWIGLAYLTKGSALLLLPVSLVVLRKNGWRSVALCAASFLVVAAPLLWRNQLVYANPFHGFNDKFLLADSYDDGIRRASHDASAHGTVAVAPHENGLGPRSVARFWREKGFRGIAARSGNGILVESFVLLRSVGPWPFDSGRAVWGVAQWAMLLLLGLAVAPSRFGWSWVIGSFLLFGLSFAWYAPIATSDRFLVPLLAPALALTAVSWSRLSFALRQRNTPPNPDTGGVIEIVDETRIIQRRNCADDPNPDAEGVVAIPPAIK